MKTIFIITFDGDVHVDNVIKYLKAWNFHVFRLNCELLLSKYEFAWWCDDKGTDFFIKNAEDGSECKGSEILSVWDRRTINPIELHVKHEDEKLNKFNLDEAKYFLEFLKFYMRDIYSIGSIVEDEPASSKLRQLFIANSLGMKTPNTVLGNRKIYAKQLLSNFDFLSLKAIRNDGFFLDNNVEQYCFFSLKIKTTDILQQAEEAFSQTVYFLQNYVEKLYELRITVIGNDVIACKIDSQILTDDTGKIDWRQGYEHGLKHEIVELPERISNFCIDFLKKMHLNFGCFDFIVTPDNEYVFLECNPNGQWLWIEDETGYDISKILAKNLVKNFN
jgi:hypothetical protein